MNWVRDQAAGIGSTYTLSAYAFSGVAIAHSKTRSISARDPDAGTSRHAAVMIWKYGVTNLNNATDKNWISVSDTTWTDIIEPYAMKISAYRPAVKSCKPGVPRGWVLL